MNNSKNIFACKLTICLFGGLSTIQLNVPVPEQLPPSIW